MNSKKPVDWPSMDCSQTYVTVLSSDGKSTSTYKLPDRHQRENFHPFSKPQKPKVSHHQIYPSIQINKCKTSGMARVKVAGTRETGIIGCLKEPECKFLPYVSPPVPEISILPTRRSKKPKKVPKDHAEMKKSKILNFANKTGKILKISKSESDEVPLQSVADTEDSTILAEKSTPSRVSYISSFNEFWNKYPTVDHLLGKSKTNQKSKQILGMPDCVGGQVKSLQDRL